MLVVVVAMLKNCLVSNFWAISFTPIWKLFKKNTLNSIKKKKFDHVADWRSSLKKKNNSGSGKPKLGCPSTLVKKNSRGRWQNLRIKKEIFVNRQKFLTFSRQPRSVKQGPAGQPAQQLQDRVTRGQAHWVQVQLTSAGRDTIFTF